MLTKYVCSTCSCEFDTAEDCTAHEAGHSGVEDIGNWSVVSISSHSRGGNFEVVEAVLSFGGSTYSGHLKKN